MEKILDHNRSSRSTLPLVFGYVSQTSSMLNRNLNSVSKLARQSLETYHHHHHNCYLQHHPSLPGARQAKSTSWSRATDDQNNQQPGVPLGSAEGQCRCGGWVGTEGGTGREVLLEQRNTRQSSTTERQAAAFGSRNLMSQALEFWLQMPCSVVPIAQLFESFWPHTFFDWLGATTVDQCDPDSASQILSPMTDSDKWLRMEELIRSSFISVVVLISLSQTLAKAHAA